MSQLQRDLWEEGQEIVPDISDRETIIQLARMTYDAYFPGIESAGWIPLGQEWRNTTLPFGWNTGDGLRGHIFTSEDESIVIVAVKGTSAGFFGAGGTAKNDKFNDNLLFSCCCARVSWTWSTVCDCFDGGNTCKQTCLEDAVMHEGVYYPMGTSLYNNVTSMYPRSQVWFIGHSLGGALAGLLGLTFGVPVVAFEAPADRLAAQRLHLPMPPDPSDTAVTHVYHTGDPIAMGTCNGVTSECALAGFAMESKCHLGQSIIYDTVKELGWSTDIRTHTIAYVINKVLSHEKWPSPPMAKPTTEDCQDCTKWVFKT